MIELYQNVQLTWCRKCSCGKEISYANKRAAVASICYLRKHSKNTCHSCCQIGSKNHRFGKPMSEKNKNVLIHKNVGNKYTLGVIPSDFTRKKISLKLKGNTHTLGFKHTEETRRKMKNKIISESTREKLRKHRWNQISKMGIKMANYNPNACLAMDAINVMLGLNLQHALNGGEEKISWYSVDGYDKENNVIFEYDEKYHNTPSHKTRDLIRQNRIVGKISPTLFLRYDEQNNQLYDAETNSTIPIICQFL